jgi:hypothetical protein
MNPKSATDQRFRNRESGESSESLEMKTGLQEPMLQVLCDLGVMPVNPL